jgi:hypothetical protein
MNSNVTAVRAPWASTPHRVWIDDIARELRARRFIRFLADEQNDRAGKTRRAVERLVQSAQAMKLGSWPEIPNGVDRFCSLDASEGSEERLRFGGMTVD